MRLVSALWHRGPALSAGIMWTAEVCTAVFDRGMHPPLHELVGTATVCATFWWLLRRMERRLTQPGPADTITLAELARCEEAQARAIATCMGASPPGARREWRDSRVRSLSGS